MVYWILFLIFRVPIQAVEFERGISRTVYGVELHRTYRCSVVEDEVEVAFD